MEGERDLEVLLMKGAEEAEGFLEEVEGSTWGVEVQPVVWGCSEGIFWVLW